VIRAGLRVVLSAALAAGLAACAVEPSRPDCPAGQGRLRTAQLFLGQDGASPEAKLALRRFIDEELTPRFPDGLTVLDGGAQWQGPENRLIRESAKVVVIVLPRRRDAVRRLHAARAAYKARFHRDAGVQIAEGGCAAL
jgi:hypothetical protein